MDGVVREGTERRIDDIEININNYDNQNGYLSVKYLGNKVIVSHKGTEEYFGIPNKSK